MLDTITLYIVVSVVAAGGAAIVGYFQTQRPDAAGARAWAIGLACLSGFFFSTVMRQHLTPFITFVVGNGITVAGLGAMHLGACRITQRRFPRGWHLAAAAFVVVTIAAFLQDPEGGYRSRVVLVGLVTCAQSVAIAWTLWGRDPRVGESELHARRLSVGVFMVMATLQFVRVLLHLPFVAQNEVSFLADTTMARWTAAIFLAICLALPFLVAYMNEARARHLLRQTVEELQTALAEVKTLRGLIPICSSCRRVRDTDQQWHSVERYLDHHTNAQLSHGVCPDCIRKLYPEYAEEILNGQ